MAAELPRPRILAIDGALARCSVALTAGGTLVAQRTAAGARGHASLLPAMAAEVLAEAGVPAGSLDAVAVVVGPGGFTGLRAALALAQGVAIGGGVPAIGVTTGEALAAALPDALRAQRAIWVAIDTRRGRMLLQRFPAGGWLAEAPPEAFEEAALPQPAGPVAIAGDAAPLVAARLTARGADVMLTDARMPDAAAVARVAAERLAGRLPPLAARPLYGEAPAARPPEGA